MAITFSCGTCRRKYSVPDNLAGKQRRCAGCGNVLTVPPPVAQDDDLPSLDDLADAPPPPPPPVPAARPARRTAAATSGAALPSASPPRASDFPASRRWSVGNHAFLGDDAARLISMLLVLAMACVSAWLCYRVGNQMLDRNAIPDELRPRFFAYVAVLAVWTLVLFAAVVTPAVMGVSSLAASWTKGALPDSAYLRTAGALSLPYMLWLGAFLVQGREHRDLRVTLALLSPFALFAGLKELAGLGKWLRSGIATALAIVVLVVAALVVKPVSGYVAQAGQKIAGIDRESLQAWAKANPDKVRAMREARYVASGGGASGGAGGNAPPAVSSAPDPLAGKIEPLQKEIDDAAAAAPRQTREQIRAKREQLVQQLQAMKPADALSHLYTRAEHALARLSSAEGEAPSEAPPANLYQPISAAPLAVPKAEEADFATETYAFKTLRVRPLKESSIDLAAFGERALFQRWTLDHWAKIQLAVEPATDPKQRRPWVADRDVIAHLAAQKNLFAVVMPGDPQVLDGQLNGLSWTRVQPNPHAASRGDGIIYAARLPDASWAIVRLTVRGAGREQIALADKFIQGIRFAQPNDPPALDPFDPAVVVKRFDNLSDDPSPVLRAAGAKGITALMQYVAAKGNQAPHRAQQLLDELAQSQPTAVAGGVTASPGQGLVPQPRPSPGGVRRPIGGAATAAPAGAVDARAALVMLQGGGSVFDKRSAVQLLAGAVPGPNDPRDEVATALENLLIGDNAHFLGEDASAALAVWWRPQTVTIMLPLLGEDVFPPSRRQNAMRVLSKTGDKRAVLPIVRWIIKDPETTVTALTAMGPVAEDEVVKLLREKDPKVRGNAARILEQIGTNKCLIELRRASNDPRDAMAASIAKAALDTVMARVKAAKPATPAATRPATAAA
ncbi:MAG TPA: hypothetical protein VER17_17000, partial [Tepidisphaeraceae bacterium]|nr:hypothetical protein [Tepidisphaeraceae bacterium]